MAIGVVVAFFGVALAVGSPASDGFRFAIGLIMVLVPEGLLSTVTVPLGAQRMAGRHALVCGLEASADRRRLGDADEPALVAT